MTASNADRRRDRGADSPRGAPKAKGPMKVSLLSGFLGSGKTSLLGHILTNTDGERCAVIVNEISEENLDARLVSAAKVLKDPSGGGGKQLVEMPNGCICCTLRTDLLEQLRELAETGRFDTVLIESSGIAEPMQVAETFFMDGDENGEPDGKPPLQEGTAVLDTCVTVVDATSVDDHLADTRSAADVDPDAPESDQRNLANLFADQIEFANTILLNKTDLVPTARRDALLALLRGLNPKAEVIPTVRGQAPLASVLRTGRFSLAFAHSHLDWMKDITEGVKHTPETLEYGISSTMFHVDDGRPFHPRRLFTWMHRYFALCDEGVADDDEEPGATETNESPQSPTEGGACARPTPTPSAEEQGAAEASLKVAARDRTARYGNLLRGKGFVWVASLKRNHQFGLWAQAGNMLNFSCGGFWDEFPDPSGDTVDAKPHQRLAFIGQDLKADVLRADLEACLLTPAEVVEYEAAVKAHLDAEDDSDSDLPPSPFDDPFVAWPQGMVDDDDDEEGEEEEGEQ